EPALRMGGVRKQTIEVGGPAFPAAGRGREEGALRLGGAADAKGNEFGVPHAPPLSEAWRKRDLDPARARLGEARATAAFEEGRAMTWDQALEFALGNS